jgi:hypothetical protein
MLIARIKNIATSIILSLSASVCAYANQQDLSGQINAETLSDYEIKFVDGKIYLRSLTLGSLIENDEDYPLLEPVILYEKTKFSRGSIFITPKIKVVQACGTKLHFLINKYQ